MARPTTRSALLELMQKEFAELEHAVGELTSDQVTLPGACEAWSVKDLLAHLDAWHELFLEWERIGSAGGRPAMPAPGFTWKETPALNQSIWERTRDDALDDVRARLADSHRSVRAVVESYDDDTLFEKRRFGWTGSTSVGSYAVSATSSHYAWATKLIRHFAKSPAAQTEP